VPRCRVFLFPPSPKGRGVRVWGLEADRYEATFIFDAGVGTAVKFYLVIMMESTSTFKEF